MIIVDVWQRRENQSSATFVNTNPIAFYFEKKKSHTPTQNPILVVVVVVASFILSFNFPVDTKLGYHILPSFK